MLPEIAAPMRGKNLLEVEAKERSGRADSRLGEFQNASSPPGFSTRANSRKTAFVIGEIAKAEGRGDEVEGRIRKRKTQRVGGDKNGGR